MLLPRASCYYHHGRGVFPLPVCLVITHIFLEIVSLDLLNACQNCLENASPVPDAKGVVHTSPGQRPGLIGQKTFPSAEGATHRGMSQAVGLGPKQIACAPRALPWAGMKQAVGLKIAVDEIPSTTAAKDVGNDESKGGEGVTPKGCG